MTSCVPRLVPEELRDNSHNTVSWMVTQIERGSTHLVLVNRPPERAVCGALVRYAADRQIRFELTDAITCGQCLKFLARRYPV